MNNEDFQYRNTYFFVGSSTILWIIILGLVLLGFVLFYLIKKIHKAKKMRPGILIHRSAVMKKIFKEALNTVMSETFCSDFSVNKEKFP
jgi:LPXTG-motif cell wall-anchored protein